MIDPDVGEYMAEFDVDVDDIEPDERYGSVVRWPDEPVDLAEVLGDVLHDVYADAGPDDLDEALENALDSMSAAEAFNFTKALRQIEAGAQRALSDPAVSQVARTSLPIAGGAVGTLIGGPVGTALGTSLGTAAAGALPVAPARGVPAAAPAGAMPRPAVAGGSAAAAQGLILSQQPDVLKALLALALGQHGKPAVNGLPVPQIMGMLSSVFGQAAADADELMYLGHGAGDGSGEALADDSAPDGRSLYTTLLDVENDELAEAMGSS